MSKLLKKSVSILLTMTLVLSCLSGLAYLSVLSVPALAASGYSPTGVFYKISETEYKIAPGVTENRLILNKTSGMQQETVYAVTVDAGNSSTGFMVGYADYNGSRWKMQKVRDQAAAAQSKTGANIVAAFNADIFNMQTGEPTGCLIMGGNIFKEGLGRPYFGVTNDGKYVMGEKLTRKVMNTLREGVSGFYMILQNGERVGPGLDPESNIAPKTCVGMKADGSIVVVCVDGRNYPVSCNLSDFDLATIMMDLGCVNVLNLDGGGSTTYLAKYEGKTALELANKPSDAVERQVASSLFIVSTARPSGEFDHAALTPNNTLYTPNSTVTFSAIGVDSAGGAAPLPADGVFALASDSTAMGSITADGVFTANDSTGVVNVNYVSGGAVVGTTSIEITTPDELYIPSEEYSLDFEESTGFDIVAKNAGRTIVIKDGDLVWSKTPEFSMNQKFVYNDTDVLYTDGYFKFVNSVDESFDGGKTNTQSFKTDVARSVKEVLSVTLDAAGDGTTKDFLIAEDPYSLKAVYINGSKQSTSKYSYARASGTLTFNTPPAADDVIKVEFNLYQYNCQLDPIPAAADIPKVTCSKVVTSYNYDETTGVLTYESLWSATTKVTHYVHTYTLEDPSDAILVYLGDVVTDTGFTYDSAAGVLAFDEPHPGVTILVKKVLPPADSQALTESLMGTFSGNTFTTAASNSCTGTVTAKSAYDDAVAVSTRAVIGAAPVMLYDFEYTDDMAEAEASGGRLTYIPSMTLPTYDRNNETGANPESLAHGVFAAQWYEEGYPLYSWPNASLGYNGMVSTVVSAEDGEPVRFGDHSLRMDMDWSSYDLSSNSNNYLRVTSPTYFFEGAPKKIGAWIYCPEGMANFCLYLNCCTNSEAIAYAPVSTTDGNDVCENWVGWKYVEIDLSDSTAPASTKMGAQYYPFGFYQSCGVFWASFQPGKGFGSRSATTIYIDNIQLIYSSNTDDTKNPEVTAITYDTEGAPAEFESNKTVLTDNTVTIRASYRDAEDKYMTGINPEAVYMHIDGVDVTDRCFINAGDEQMYLYDAQLDNGVHSVSVTVYDNFGNKTTDTRYFTVDGTSPATAELVAEQENPILGETYVLDVKAADAADVAGADIAVHTFAAFTYFYDDVTVTPAEGYALDGEAIYDSTNAIIKFKLVKDGDAVPEDGVIARISYNVPPNVRSDSIDVRFRVDKGGITYASEKDEKYLGSFGGTVETSCIAPIVVTSDTFLVGQGGNFYVKDLEGNPVSGATLVFEDGTAVSATPTDAEGKLYTEAFKEGAVKFTVRAEKGDMISFYYTSQSYASGGSEDGMPTSIALNGARDGSSMINVTWFSNPSASAGRAVARYAAKADYEANGEAALREIEGLSRLEELNSTSNVDTNYALRFNKVVIGGLTPETEYVYFVGDGEKMSNMRTFKTGKKNVDTDFFIIGDMQDEDTANLNAILDALQKSDVNYAFGLQTGDAVDNGGQYRWWVNVASVFSSGYLSTRPIVHVLGNHEFYGDYDGENSADYFGMTTVDGKAPLAYSTSYGNVYMAVINYTDDAATYAEAIEWVRNDAAASTAAWKVLTLHQPAYYTNPGGGSDNVNRLVPPLVDEVGFDFVFSGHDHSYVRTYPVTGGERDDENGAVYYICGSTGEKSYAVVENEAFPYAFVRGSAATEGEYNAIYLTASTTDTTFTVNTHDVTIAGDGTYTDDIIDSYTMTKAITCSETGEHVFSSTGSELVCSVCGYTKPIGNYTGFAEDAATGRMRYYVYGESKTGWLILENDCYYFDENGLTVPAGKRTIDGIEYTFDSEGKQKGGVFIKTEDGYTRCYRGGNYLTGWNEIDGKTYFFSTSASHPGKMLTGKTTIVIFTGQKITYNFASDGHLLDYVWVEEDGGMRYYWAQNPVTGWMTIDGKQYYFDPATALMQTGEVEIDGQIYSFGDDGVFKHEGPHDYVYSNHTEASCTVAEGDVYICTICGTTKKDITSPATGHVDENNDDLCDVCGKYYKAKISFLEPLLRFFIRIRNWFFNLFRRG